MANGTDTNKGFHGLSNVHIWFIGDNDEYDATATAIPGAVRLSWQTDSESSGFSADNDPNYLTVSSAASGSGEIEMAKFPDDVVAKMLGWEVDTNGALVQTTDGVPTPFAIAYQIEGDKTPRAGIIYKVQVTPPSSESATGTDIKTQTLPYTASQVTIDGRKLLKANLTKSVNPTKFAAFFTAPYEPEFDETPAVEDGN